ncbi:GDP-perosamine synthase [subsurface metagenome]
MPTVFEMITLSAPFINGNEWNYVKECLDTGWVSSVGSYVDKFEQNICAFSGARYAVACVNGTAALHTALQVVGVKAGDEVIVPTVTFIAPVNAVRYVGAEPVFMDCDDFYNIDVLKTKEFIENETVFKNGLTYNKKTGRCIRAIVPVHVFGNAVDLGNLISICKERNIKVIEDAAESLGTCYNSGDLEGRHTGTIGDIGCYSFNGNKIITTGGGGMIVTDNSECAERARYLTTQAKDDASRYIHNEVGYNYRLTNIQAALGVAQLEQLPEFIAVKKRNYNAYKEAIDNIVGLHLAEVPTYADNNYWMCALQVEKDFGEDKEALMERLVSDGIQTRPLWYLNHLQKPYKQCQAYRIEKACGMFENALCTPCSVGLKQGDIKKIVMALKKRKTEQK